MAFTLDAKTIDSAGAFFVGELERLDKTLHMPLASVTWGRDIDLRSDVSIADEVSSFTNTSFASPGGSKPGGKSFISGNSTAITGIDIDTRKTGNPLYLWGKQLAYTVIELESAAQIGRPIDAQKHKALALKHNMDTDEMVYIGDSEVGETGLVNNPNIPPENVTTNWLTATADQILGDINGILEMAWERSGYTICPGNLLLPPKSFARLLRPVSTGGSVSILNYVRENCLAFEKNGRKPEINALKWLDGIGAANTGRAVAYTKDESFVRFPLVPLQHTPVEHRGLHQITTYYGRLGVVEFVYPETVAYADGL